MCLRPKTDRRLRRSITVESLGLVTCTEAWPHWFDPVATLGSQPDSRSRTGSHIFGHVGLVAAFEASAPRQRSQDMPSHLICLGATAGDQCPPFSRQLSAPSAPITESGRYSVEHL